MFAVGLLVSGCWGSSRAPQAIRLGISWTDDGVRIDYRACRGETIERILIEQSDGDNVAFENGDLTVFDISSDDISSLQRNGFVNLAFDRMSRDVSVGEEWLLGVYTSEAGEIFFGHGFTLAPGDDGVRTDGGVLSREEFDQQARDSLADCG